MSYENQGTGIDYAQLIDRVLGDNLAMANFENQWYRISQTLFDDRPRGGVPFAASNKLGIRVSDAGNCVQQLWAELHGLLDIPENTRSLDDKMQPGILDGARTACLIAAGIERWYWPLSTSMELSIDANGVPGHADVIVSAEPDPIEVVECKQTMYSRGIDDPATAHPYWLYQCCRYAQAVQAPFFVILAHAPAAFKGATRQSFRYATIEWAVKTDAEYARLARAQEDEQPEPDVLDDERSWRCKSCRYSQCSEGWNVNPKRKLVEVIVDEVGVV